MPVPSKISGWVPDLPDKRDFRYTATFNEGVEVPFWGKVLPCLAKPALPPSADLLQYKTWPAVYNQGALGSCTAQAVVAMNHFLLGKEGEDVEDRNLSRLMLYGEARYWVPADTGATLRDSLKSLAKVGLCQEELWPYRIANYTEKPPASAYENAAPRKSIVYARISGEYEACRCLADGYPFVFGFSVYPSIYQVDRDEPVLRLPRAGERLLGGHAVVAVGYDKKRGLLRIRNSWGADWGVEGCFLMPFEYAFNRDLADDFWAIRSAPVV